MKPPSVWVVDDEPAVLVAAKAVLQNAGFAVEVMDDGDGALAQLQSGADGPDLILLDVALPGIRGDELMLALLSLTPRSKIVLWSGYDEAEVLRRLAVRPAAFVQKPAGGQELVAVLRRLLCG